MAKLTFKGSDEYALKLSQLAGRSDEVAKMAVYSGAKIVADKIKANLDAMPTEQFRFLRGGDKFTGLTKDQKEDLLESFGITSITRDGEGYITAKIGFDGYGRMKTRKYPNGLPNPLLARAVESGSSVRKKHPFVRPAVDATRKAVIEKMDAVIEEEIRKLGL